MYENSCDTLLIIILNHLQLAGFLFNKRPHVAPFVKKIIADSDDYIQNIVRVDPKYREVVDECINNHPSCSEWALGTGCDDNPKCKCIRLCVLYFGPMDIIQYYSSGHTSFSISFYLMTYLSTLFFQI